MGEINTTVTLGKHAASGRKKLSTRVDLTPMVDLGFLLITFFIFTTSMSKPTVMKLILPSDKYTSIPSETAESKTLNIIINGNNKFSFYHGFDSLHIMEASNTEIAFRNLLIKKKAELVKKFGNAEDLMVVIRPTEEANYKSIVNILDEIKINGITRYALLN